MTRTTRAAVARTVERGLRYAIVAVFVVGLRRWNPGAIVNAVVALAATYVPDVIERRYGIEFRPWQRVYTGVAMLLHAVGMLGPYDHTWWWDEVTHVLSATLLGGIIHAAARRRDRDPRPPVLVGVACLGILWELVEYTSHAIMDRLGFEPVLIPYSTRDTVVDVLFNLFGAVLVLAFGDRLLRNFTQFVD